MYGVYLSFAGIFEYDNGSESFDEPNQWRDLGVVDDEITAQLYVLALNQMTVQGQRNQTMINVFRKIFSGENK